MAQRLLARRQLRRLEGDDAASISSRSMASAIDRTHDAFRHSARGRPLKASQNALSVGLPGLEKSIPTPLRCAHLLPEAHPAPRSIQATRPIWSPRRVPPRCHRSKPPKACKADPATRYNACLSKGELTRARPNVLADSQLADFFNAIGAKQTCRGHWPKFAETII